MGADKWMHGSRSRPPRADKMNRLSEQATATKSFAFPGMERVGQPFRDSLRRFLVYHPQQICLISTRRNGDEGALLLIVGFSIQLPAPPVTQHRITGTEFDFWNACARTGTHRQAQTARPVLEEGVFGRGVGWGWYRTVCVQNMAQRNMSFGKFLFFSL